jgi:hypothetical protein
VEGTRFPLPCNPVEALFDDRKMRADENIGRSQRQRLLLCLKRDCSSLRSTSEANEKLGLQ